MLSMGEREREGGTNNGNVTAGLISISNEGNKPSSRKGEVGSHVSSSLGVGGEQPHPLDGDCRQRGRVPRRKKNPPKQNPRLHGRERGGAYEFQGRPQETAGSAAGAGIKS